MLDMIPYNSTIQSYLFESKSVSVADAFITLHNSQLPYDLMKAEICEIATSPDDPLKVLTKLSKSGH